MRNLLLKAGVLAGLMLVFGATGYAQISQEYRADVPFDFQVKNVKYAAGEYAVGPLSSNAATGAVAILDRKNGERRIIGLTQLGAGRTEGDGKLMFVKINGVYTLSHIITRTFDLKVKTTQREMQLAKNFSQKWEMVAIAIRH